MQRTLTIIGLLALSFTIATQATAQKKGGNRGGNRRGGVQIKFNTGNHFNNKFNKNHHFNKFSNHHKFNNHFHNKFKNHGKINHKFHNVKYHYNVNQKYFYNLKYVRWSHFPYRICVYNNQYWVLYGNQWMPYHYLVQNNAGCWNWHQKHFHKLKHTKVNVNFYKFKK